MTERLAPSLNDTESLFMCLSSICVSSLEKMSILIYLPFLKNQAISLLLIYPRYESFIICMI